MTLKILNHPPVTRRTALAIGLGTALAACTRADADRDAAPHATRPAAPRDVGDPDLVAEAMLLPGLVESATQGPLITLLQALDEVYAEGRIVVGASPVGRVIDSVTRGTADLGLPALRLRPDADARLPYRFSTASFGRVEFVLYSRKAQPVTRDAVVAAPAPGTRPLVIEAPNYDFGFPIKPFSDFESAFRKVSAGRIDAFLWAQEEADLELRRLGLADIRRESFGDFEDVFLVPRGPRGDHVDAILSRTLSALRRDGRLETLYRSIHRPYDPWQP